MIEDNIYDGDIVLVKHQSVAENGDKVVALINDNEVTLKKYFKEDDQVCLKPANPKMAPLYVDFDNIRIQGKVVSIIRNLKNRG